MLIDTVAVGVFRCNCIIVACETTRQALVVDPGDYPDRILSIIHGRGLRVACVLHTHAHLDHVMGAFGVVEATGAPVRLHGGDYSLWHNVAITAARHGIRPPPMPPLADPLADGEMIRVGVECVRVIHTPGHTAGSCCFAFQGREGDQVLLSGDTLFKGAIGVRLRGGTSTWTPTVRQVVASIRDRLLTLGDDTRVLPGHGPDTSIGAERRGNPFLHDAEDETCQTSR